MLGASAKNLSVISALAGMTALLLAACDGGGSAPSSPLPYSDKSVARQWNEEALAAIRMDLARPPVHARNLFYLSAAMWDAWAAYGGGGDAYVRRETLTSANVEADRAIAISYAAYRVLSHLYSLSVNAERTQDALDARMQALGLDPGLTNRIGTSPAAVGNRIAASVLALSAADGANEANNYRDTTNYTPANQPLIVKEPGTTMADPNRWQPLALDRIVDQSGNPLPGRVQTYVGSHWNNVRPFALTRANLNDVYIDPGPPPQLGGAGDQEFKDGVVEVLRFASQHDPANPATVDISPGALGNNSDLDAATGPGYAANPVTGEPYAPHVVKRADFQRVLSEFWADGPESETPPGHWNVVANSVSDDNRMVKRIGGTGPVVNDLEWDIKLYFALNGATHDAAIACWGVKRKYDSPRPISQIRYMGGLGQSSDPAGPSYHPDGLPLAPGLIEVITPASSAPGGGHAHLAGFVGEIALYSWPGEPDSPQDVGGAVWLRAKNWVAYQRKTFVTPPFAAYFSGHSTYSRAAAEILTSITASPYFPGGFGEFVAQANQYLRTERGPSADVRLQWASYYDAADQAGLSRLFGGIHPRVDNLTGRRVGKQVGENAWTLAARYFDGTAVP